MQQSSDITAFAIVLFLPCAGWILSRPPVWRRVRARLEPAATAAWRQLVASEEPEDEVLRQWAVLRLEQLQRHLVRVRRLILDDAWMTATRQRANRLAYEHLVRDVHDAESVVAAFGPIEPWLAPATPTPSASPRLAFSAPAARSSTEVMEFGPRGRWI